MKISAVVPTYNDEDVIVECLQSLLNQTRKFDEISVVDDGSTDGTLKAVKKFPVRIIQTKHKERSHARNIGWRNATGEIVAFIESDSIYDERWTEKVLEEFEKGADAVIDRRAVYKPRTFIAKYNDEMFNLRYKNYKPFSAWVFKKEVLEKLGGFDENIAGPEDVELGYRVIKNGCKIAFAREALQYHKGEPKTLVEILRRSWWFGGHMHEYYKKHPEKVPYSNLAAYSLPVVLLVLPSLWMAYMTILYTGLLLRSMLKGLKLEYALASPALSISSGVIFNIAFAHGLLKRILSRRQDFTV